MVSDQEIANGVESLLRQSNPNTVTSINGVVQQLEAKLGLDLSHKAGFIRDQIDLLLRTHAPRPPPQQKDHFAYQQHQQFQNAAPQPPQFPPRYALPHPHRPEGLNFRFPPAPQQQPPAHHHYSHVLHQLPPRPEPRHHPAQLLKSPDGVVATVPPANAHEVSKESAPTGAKRRGGPGGLNKLCGVSPELQAIVGEPALARTQIVKQLWAYIRKNNLQDPNNKRRIICNDALRLVFETDCTDMFKMNKLLAKHIIPLEPTKEPGSDSKRMKVETESASESAEAGSSPGISSPPLIISDALAKFFGTEEKEMLQSDAIGRIWEYIKANNLEDPLSPTTIICDQKLQDLFGCESISKIGVPEMLMRHFFKQS